MQVGSYKNHQDLYFAKISHILYDKPFSDNKCIIVRLSIILLNMLHVIPHTGKYTWTSPINQAQLVYRAEQL